MSFHTCLNLILNSVYDRFIKITKIQVRETKSIKDLRINNNLVIRYLLVRILIRHMIFSLFMNHRIILGTFPWKLTNSYFLQIHLFDIRFQDNHGSNFLAPKIKSKKMATWVHMGIEMSVNNGKVFASTVRWQLLRKGVVHKWRQNFWAIFDVTLLITKVVVAVVLSSKNLPFP